MKGPAYIPVVRSGDHLDILSDGFGDPSRTMITKLAMEEAADLMRITRGDLEETIFTPFRETLRRSIRTFMTRCTDRRLLPAYDPDTPISAFAAMIEFDIEKHWSEEEDPVPGLDVQVAKGFRDTLTLFSAMLLHVDGVLRALPDGAGDRIGFFFNLDSFHICGICVLIPIDLIDIHHRALQNAIFRNGLDFPPSHHARIEGLKNIIWEIDPALTDPAIIPGPYRALAAKPS